MPKSPLGRLPRDAIRALDLPRLPQDLIGHFKNPVDLSGTISDAMDELGMVAVIPSYVLPPVNTGSRIVGRALTARNIDAGASITNLVTRKYKWKKMTSQD